MHPAPGSHPLACTPQVIMTPDAYVRFYGELPQLPPGGAAAAAQPVAAQPTTQILVRPVAGSPFVVQAQQCYRGAC